MKKLLLILGASASGKTTLAEYLESRYQIENIPVYSTRPSRNSAEAEFYLTELEYKSHLDSGDFLLTSQHKDWFYGVFKEDVYKAIRSQQENVLVVTPAWLRKLQRTIPEDIYSIYLNVDESDRMIKRLQRGDAVEEATRRHWNDKGMFDGIEEEVDRVIDNLHYELSIREVAHVVKNIFEENKRI